MSSKTGKVISSGATGTRVAEAHVHLHRHDGIADRGSQLDPDAGVFVLGTNVLARHGTRIIDDSIRFYFNAAQFAENLRQPLWRRLAKAEQIQIAGSPVQH